MSNTTQFVVTDSGLFPDKVRSTLLLFAFLMSLISLVLSLHSRIAPQLEPATLAASVPMHTVKKEKPEATSEPVAFEQKTETDDRILTLAEYVSKRYRVSMEATVDLVSTAYAAGEQTGLDPLLILAVMAVESHFNPIAESVAGAKGLMQVIPKYHMEKIIASGGEKAMLEPGTNILLGAKILGEYIARAGDLATGLQMYNGAPDDSSNQYAAKVINEKERLQQILKNSRNRA
jgi:hypothetical protein